MALISCNNITLGYESKDIISNLTLQINNGDYICVIGENGSGKSTLMKAILGLKKVNSGSISFSDGLKQNEIGYIPQQNIIQRDFPASVYEVVISGCINKMGIKPFYSKKEKSIANENINRLGLDELKYAPYNTLSGGQQQRVLLARALCATKKILLLDEPVTGLDPHVTAELYDIINEINKSGITIVMISHDLKGCIDNASHILQLDDDGFYFAKKEDYILSEIGQKFIGRN